MQQTAAQHLARAQAFERQGDMAEAERAYGLALTRAPGNVDAHIGRGWALIARGAHDAAVADFDAALAAQPDTAETHFARGWALEKAGRRRAAVADYSAAIDLAPGYLDAYMSRGVLAFYDGAFATAAEDFAVVYGQDQEALGDYALIWEFISRARAGTSRNQRDADFANRWHRTDWPGAVYAHLRGRASVADVLKWTDIDDAAQRRARQCVAYFFLGQARLLEGDDAGARRYFQKTLETQAASYRQFGAARVELTRMSK